MPAYYLEVGHIFLPYFSSLRLFGSSVISKLVIPCDVKYTINRETNEFTGSCMGRPFTGFQVNASVDAMIVTKSESINCIFFMNLIKYVQLVANRPIIDTLKSQYLERTLSRTVAFSYDEL